MLTGAEIRSQFLKFYEERGHKVLPSASLVPEDPTVLLTIAGMLPFKPIFLGQREAEFLRATTSQKCIRTNDIENVGRTKRHHTFFEMLGNFSFGDYFKKQAISWGWELITKVFKLPPEHLIVSVFHEDEDAFAIWRDDIGIPAHRIQRMGEDNFWSSGVTGPCGPCSEIYYDFNPEAGDQNINLEDGDRFLEIYNLVFMELNRNSDSTFTPLKKQNIDTGLGLERMAQVLQKVPNNYETDLIFPILKTAADIANIDYHTSAERVKTSLKVIGDHVRSVVHMIADGITASNVGRGYILRRLLRRVVRHGRLIGISGEFTPEVAETAIALSEVAYPQVRERAAIIKSELQKEENRFLQTLERGERMLAEILASPEIQARKIIKGADAFTLYDTYGFPLELTQEIAEEEGLSVDVEGFRLAMQHQQERSKDAHVDIDLLTQMNWSEIAVPKTEFVGYIQTNAQAQVQAIIVNGQIKLIAKSGDRIQIILNQTPFYAESGGQIGDKGYLLVGDTIIRIDDVQKESDLFVHIGQIERGELKLEDIVIAQVSLSDRRRSQAHHTSTHLLQAALKKIVDPNILQAGSLVTGDRLRFDFNLSRGVTGEEIREVENLINTWIMESHSAEITVMAIAEAKAKGAVAMFGEKYGAEVRVIDIPNVSMELCGGTHVSNTAEIGIFKIVSESGVASGIRRIEAVAGQAVVDYLNLRDGIVRELSDRFKVKPEEIPDRITGLQTELKNSQKQTETLQRELALLKSDSLISQAIAIGDFKILVTEIKGIDPESLKIAAERLQAKLGNSAVVLGSIPEPDKVSLVAAFSPEVIKKGLNAGKFIGAIAKITGGGGGGRPNLAQAGGKEPDKLPEAISKAMSELKEALE